MSNVFKFTIELDQDAWDSLDEDGKAKWLSDICTAINDHAYISDVEAL